MRELILGGQKSGKTARAESLAAAWLARSPSHRAVYVATAQAGDEEMSRRITRHRQDRARRVPGMVTVEEPLELGAVVELHSDAKALVVVDCLTLWLTNWLMPAVRRGEGEGIKEAAGTKEAEGFDSLSLWERAGVRAGGNPLILISNEIGLGVIPMGRETREFVDALGRLNQHVAAACDRVTLMAAGLPLTLKDTS